LLFRKKFDGLVNEKTIEQVRAAWKKIADRLNVPVISFDTPLWILGETQDVPARIKLAAPTAQ
jgi:N-glycosylase/DNA lyase